MDKKLKILFLFLLFTNVLHAQYSEYEYKAAFIERFTRFIDWPEEFEDNTFEIAVIGENPFNKSLDELFDITKIKNRNTEVIYTDNINELRNVDLVFISRSEKNRMKEIVSVIDDMPILIISDSKGFCKKGAHINMYVDGDYIRYEINQKALEKTGLKVRSLLFASAKIVKSDD